MARRLALRTEHLTSLSPGDLASVLGGQGLTGYYPTFDGDCDTLAVCVVTGVTGSTH